MNVQVAVHGDEPESVTEEKFSDFLVNSCLHGTGGTVHQLYRLAKTGQLIAVGMLIYLCIATILIARLGVVDLLPSGLSSVYCFYEPLLPELSLGKYTALREIYYCCQQGYENYYMGFYIDGCEKMKYKADYRPSQLLCPTTFQWYDLEASLPLLRLHKFTPLDSQLALKMSDKSYPRNNLAPKYDGNENDAQTTVNNIKLYIDGLSSS